MLLAHAIIVARRGVGETRCCHSSRSIILIGASDEFPMDVCRVLAIRCTPDEELMENHIKPQWLDILDSILALGRTKEAAAFVHSDPQEALGLWKQFGVHLGISEGILRLSQIDRMCQTLGPVPGCGWYRCPLHLSNKTVPLAEGLICSGCHKVPWWSTPPMIMPLIEGFLGSVLRPSLPTQVRRSGGARFVSLKSPLGTGRMENIALSVLAQPVAELLPAPPSETTSRNIFRNSEDDLIGDSEVQKELWVFPASVHTFTIPNPHHTQACNDRPVARYLGGAWRKAAKA